MSENIMGDEEILERLEILRKWQTDQEETLKNSLSNELTYEEFIQMKQLKLYEIFGLNNENITKYSIENDSSLIKDLQLNDEISESESIVADVKVDEEVVPSIDKPPKNEENPIQNKQTIKSIPNENIIISPNKNYSIENLEILRDNLRINTIKDGHVNEQGDTNEESNDLLRKPYLKRGEGLTNRFRIHPDTFRLDRLPRYKYADRTKQFRKKKFVKKPLKPLSTNSTSIEHTKLQLKKSVKSETNIIKQTLDIFVPNVEVSLQQKSEAQESFQEAKQKLDDWVNKNIIKDKTPNEMQIHSDIALKDNSTNPKNVSNNSTSNENDNDVDDRITWAKVLEDANESIAVPRSINKLFDTPTRKRIQQEIDELNIFELLENKVDNSSFCSNDSLVKKLLNFNKKKNTSDLSDSTPLTTRKDTQNLNINALKPLPSVHNVVSDNSDESSECGEASSKDISKGHVQFSEKIKINDNDDSNSTSSNFDDDLPNCSTPNDKRQELQSSFEQFRSKIYEQLNNQFTNDQQQDEDTTIINDSASTAASTSLTLQFAQLMNAQKNNISQSDANEFKLKSEQLKTHLLELEQEITLFRTQNTELIKIKQNHELEKTRLQQERSELEEYLSNERIKLEVYLHDERIKIAEEKTNLEKRLKTIRTANRKEDQREVNQLKEQLNELKREQNAKDQKHIGVQSRLRAQIRTMEKDLKDYQYEMDGLRKDNKKLEAENIRLRRQHNNKMLQEINKNIAKLTPIITVNNAAGAADADERIKSNTKMKSKKQLDEDNVKIVLNKSHKTPVIAKVISHRNYPITTDHHRNRCKNVKFAIHDRSKSVPNLTEQDNIDNRYCDSDDASSSLSSSSSSLSDDKDPSKSNATSSYFPNQTTKKSKTKQAIVTENDAGGNDGYDVKTPVNPDHVKEVKDFKREIQNDDGSKEIWYPNGNLKKISSDGMLIKMLYYNKDIKETNIHEGTVKYYYAETKIWHTTYLDGLEIIEFPNGQTEHRYKDGKIEVHFPNGSIRLTNPNNTELIEEWKYVDGRTFVQKKSGEKILTLPNGQCEIQTKNDTRRIYPDGTVKIVFADGSQETRYSNGRTRLKDKDGNLVMDSEKI